MAAQHSLLHGGCGKAGAVEEEQSGTCGHVPEGAGGWAVVGVVHQDVSVRRQEQLKERERKDGK